MKFIHPRHIQISAYNYSLPEERIAKYPLAERDLSKLLIYKESKIAEAIYKDLAFHLPAESLLIFNDTKVVEARMLFHTFSGATIELFYLEAVSEKIDASLAMQAKGELEIKCYVGNAKRWKYGPIKRIVEINGKTIEITASNKERVADYYHLTLSWTPSDLLFAEILHIFGTIPLPPYLKRETEENDFNRYQTVFAKELGSVAAPTAGLHFTENILNDLKQKGIETSNVTLHVGAGTFKPVKSEEIGGHEMHGEYLDVSLETIEHLIQSNGKKIVAVGTTSTRTLESLYWLGRKVFYNPTISISELVVNQWEPYEELPECTALDSLSALSQWMVANDMKKILTKTNIIIAPGYKFQVIDGILTNFHQPESTLLLLISALIGEDWKKVYDFALQNEYRFLSYGDGSLLWKND